jgi:Rps23 Pro-64 3,4-dihydroxylase Tpa1-like proline 4-hydroxylase
MLNPALDAAALARDFRVARRLLIHDILEPQAALAARACLANEVPWSFTYRLDGRDVVQPPAEMAALPFEERMRLGHAILSQARRDFTFGFMTFPLLHHYDAGRYRELYIARVLEALASARFIEFARAVTGNDRIRRVDAQATSYTGGHFLSLHDDADYAGEERLAAYVLNFSSGWRAEWGGLLQFVGDDGSVTDSYVPHFNSMSIFAVPAKHLVSYVAPYAMEPRLSITGWFTA